MVRNILALGLIAIALQGCATVDQYESRINDANINSQDSLNQEVLLNILRASRNQAPNFMAISQVAGGQTEALQTGLPSIFIGAHTGNNPLTNSLSSAVTGSYQSNPLITTAFQTGMLSPISPRTVALLVASHPREVVFNLLFEAIEIKLKNADRARLENDPANNYPGKTPCAAISTLSDRERVSHGQECSYAKFQSLLHGLISFGLTADLDDSSSNGANAAQAGSSASTSTPTGLPGKFCFDAGLAYRASRGAEVRKRVHKLCDDSSNSPAKEKETGSTSTYTQKYTKNNVENTVAKATTYSYSAAQNRTVTYQFGDAGDIEIRFVLRSPVSVIKFLGHWVNTSDVEFAYYGPQAQKVLGSEPYFNVTADGGHCYTSVAYYGGIYCVPATSTHTPMLMEIVEDLRNLSIQPSDLNASFTVRVAN